MNGCPRYRKLSLPPMFRNWVSVVMPAFNRVHYLSDAVQSVYMQTYRPLQLVMIDDGSVDGTLQKMREIQYKMSSSLLKIDVIIHEENKGVSSARNTGMSVCVGEYLQFLDSDDLYHPFKTDICVRHLAESEADLAVPLCRGFNDDEVKTILTSNTAETINKECTRSDPLVSEFLWSVNSPLMKRVLIEKTGGFLESIHYGEDREYFARVRLNAQRMVRIPQRLSYFRRGVYDRLTCDHGKSNLNRRRKNRAEAEVFRIISGHIKHANKWNKTEKRYIRSRLHKIAKRMLRDADWAGIYMISKVLTREL